MVAILPLQNVKADKLEPFNITTNVTSNYQGNVSTTIDDNRESFWWTAAAQAVNDHVTIEYKDVTKINDIMLFFTSGDRPAGAAVEISKNNDNDWVTVANFTENDIQNNRFTCNANGAEAKYVRMRITTATSKWLQFAEFEVYEYLSERTVSVEALEGGVVTAGGNSTSCTSEQIVTIEAIPNGGYMFHYWKVGDEIISYNYRYEDLSNKDITYTAVFVETPNFAKYKYYIKSKETDSYLTVKKYNSGEEQSYQTVAKDGEGNADQIFILEPAIEYNKFYIKSESGYYLNCASWNAYAQNEKTTPILFDEIETNIYTLYQATSTHKHGYLNVQTNHNNGLYCDATSATSNSTKWILEQVEETDKSELQELIAETEELLEKVAGHEIIEGDKINISGKITSNAAQNNEDGNSGATNDGKGIAGLTDDDITTYFHSRWGGQAIDEDHYLQIELNDENSLSNFCFSYSVRKGNSNTETSPAPSKIEVRVSADGSNFGEPVAIFTATGNNLPGYTDHGATLWHSGVISAKEAIRYIRLTVTESVGPGNTEWEGHKFFAMSALNIYSTKLSEEYSYIKEEYKNSVTLEQITAIVNALATAKATNGNNEATQTQADEAASALNTALEALKVATISHKLTVTSAGWATLFLDFNAAIPENVDAYIVTAVNKDYVTLTDVTGVLPANTGVIVNAEEGNYTFAASTKEATVVTGNLLEGSVSDEYIQGAAYVLANGENGIGMYKAELNMNAEGNNVGKDNGTHFLNNANKAYLPASAVTTGAATSASLRFDFDGITTAVEDITEKRAESKEIYDLTGRRVNEITKAGVYIIGGRKILVK